jgi:Tfp pilus assembly protein PilX
LKIKGINVNYSVCSEQRGAALITSLLIVLVISILGVAVGQQVIALRKVSTANYDYTLSINNAESALSEADDVINSNFLSPDVIQGLSVDLIATNNWWRNNGQWVSAAVVTDVTEGSPAYLIENAGLDGGIQIGTNAIQRRFYRVTAKAQGKGDTTAFLQSYYAILE